LVRRTRLSTFQSPQTNYLSSILLTFRVYVKEDIIQTPSIQADTIQKMPKRIVLIMTLIALFFIQDFLQKKPANIQPPKTERMQMTIAQNVSQVLHGIRSVSTITGKTKSQSRNIENIQNNITKLTLEHLICFSLVTSTIGRAKPTKGTTLDSPINAYLLNL
jgi:hypothetical protein